MKVYTRKQVMYSIDIGSSNNDFHAASRFMRHVAKQVSYVTGGCTLVNSLGYWADVERADREDYSDVAIGTENNVQLQVKAEVEKEEKLERTIVESVVEAADMYPELEINWVCGHKVLADGTTVAFNFSVEENL